MFAEYYQNLPPGSLAINLDRAWTCLKLDSASCIFLPDVKSAAFARKRRGTASRSSAQQIPTAIYYPPLVGFCSPLTDAGDSAGAGVFAAMEPLVKE